MLLESMLKDKEAPMKIKLIKLIVGGIAAFVAEELARKGVDKFFDEDETIDSDEE